MKQLPKAEEFLQQNNVVGMTDLITPLMIEFAKLHVEMALESALKNTREWHGNHGMLKQSILNAYPLDNIK